MEAGFSTFVTNCVESSWFVDDMTYGVTKKDTTDRVFRCVRERGVVWHNDAHLRAIQYRPTDRIPNALLRGSVWEKRTCLYEEGFYRLNVEQIEHHVRRGRHFVWDAGQRGLFSQVWVMPKVKFADYNVDRMRQHVYVMFARIVQNCKQFYLTLDCEFNLYSMRDFSQHFHSRVPCSRHRSFCRSPP